MIEQITSNWVCWAILVLALACYQQLWATLFGLRLDGCDNAGAVGATTGVMITALPLLGLLGTIIGLLDCFAEMSRGNASGNLLSGGIADALLTTQLGLVCAVPGWLLHAYVKSTALREVLQAREA